jgi:hypothetical protein
MMYCAATGQNNHRMKLLKLWAKRSLSSFSVEYFRNFVTMTESWLTQLATEKLFILEEEDALYLHWNKVPDIQCTPRSVIQANCKSNNPVVPPYLAMEWFSPQNNAKVSTSTSLTLVTKLLNGVFPKGQGNHSLEFSLLIPCRYMGYSYVNKVIIKEIIKMKRKW